MASVVITVEREGERPSRASLGVIATARRFADRHGATVYASCSIHDSDDLDEWVSALGAAGTDRVALARSGAMAQPGAPVHAQIHAEIVKRLRPSLVLVPASETGGALAEELVDLLVPLGPSLIANLSLIDAAEPPDISQGLIIGVVDGLEPDEALGSDDIDVLFYEVDPEEKSESTDTPGTRERERAETQSELDVAEPTPAT